MDETNVVFTKNMKHNKYKKEETLEINEKNVTIQSRTGGSVVMNFEGTESEIMDVANFFSEINDVEPIKVNIAGSGDVDHYFRGLSEIVEDEEGLYKLRVTLQFLSTTV
jgi:hypothetical protein